MTPEETWLQLFAAYLGSTGAARTAAWNAAINFLVENPRLYAKLSQRGLTEGVKVAVERILLRAFAAKGVQRAALATARPSVERLCARMAANLAIGPKSFHPGAEAVIIVGCVLFTVAEVHAEEATAAEKLPAYEKYVTWYMGKIMQIVAAKPHMAPHLAEPKTFDQWLAENR